MPGYHSIFDHNDHVYVLQRSALEAFQKEWKAHHPVTDGHLQFAGQRGFIEDVFYYHGGDVLYTLYQRSDSGEKVAVAGVWHEAVLREFPPAWKPVRANTVLEAVPGVRNGQSVVVVRNAKTHAEYLVSRQSQAKLVAQKMSEVFAARDAQMVALKYGFELDFKPEPQ